MTDRDQVVAYLTQYGYVAPSDTEPGKGVAASNELLQVAVAQFQELAAVPVTGELDDVTLEAMDRPRCGFPDRVPVALPGSADSDEFNTSGTRWTQAIITYRIYNTSPDLDDGRQRQIVREAFDRWSAVVPLLFVEVGADQEGDIRIRFAAGAHNESHPLTVDPAFDGPGRVLAHAFFPPPNAADLAGDIHLDEDETWQDGVGGTGFDLLTVLVHEIGHSLGLRHTDVPNSTMNPFYPTPNVPAADDRAGIRQVYREHIWIASLYRDLLSRRFDDTGLDGWVQYRLNGATIDAVVRGFCYSQEHSERIASQLYFKLLDRAGSPQEVAGWADLLRRGTSRQAVMIGFLASPEYQRKHSSAERFVESLYRRLLNRQPDPAGYVGWLDQMKRGATHRDVAWGFLYSEEYTRSLVNEQYVQFLRRTPDPTSWQAWADRVRRGLAHQDLVTGLLASDEYRNAVVSWW